MTRWVCRFGSPVRVSQWSNPTANAPRVASCATPFLPTRVNSACFSSSAKTVIDCGCVCFRDTGLGGGVGERPQHACGLRQRERQVEPGHRDRRAARAFLCVNPIDELRPFDRADASWQAVGCVRRCVGPAGLRTRQFAPNARPVTGSMPCANSRVIASSSTTPAIPQPAADAG